MEAPVSNTNPGSTLIPDWKRHIREALTDRIIWIILLVLYLLAITNSSKTIQSPEPTIIEESKPNYSLKTWMSEDYQKSYEKYAKNRPYFGKQLLQVKNQLDYNYLAKFNVAGAVVGKNNTIFLDPHLKAALGLDYVGDTIIAERVRKLSVIQDSLINIGISLICVFAPGKGSYFKENIPDSYSKYPKKKTNFQELLAQSKKRHLTYIDLKTWFERNKSTTKYPIISPYGMHWTYYAQCLAVDTICKFISQHRHTPVNFITLDDVELTKQPKFNDEDLLKKGNLLEPPPRTITYAYPKINYVINKELPQTKILRIGDSFWGGDMISPTIEKLFNNGKLWYYGSTVFPDSHTKKKEVWELNVKNAIEENQVLLLLYTEHNFGGYGNNFADEIYELYTAPDTYKKKMEEKQPLFIYIKQIRSNPVKLKQIETESINLSISVDSLIYREALKLSKQSIK